MDVDYHIDAVHEWSTDSPLISGNACWRARAFVFFVTKVPAGAGIGRGNQLKVARKDIDAIHPDNPDLMVLKRLPQ